MKKTSIYLSFILSFVFLSVASFAQLNTVPSLTENNNLATKNFKKESNKRTAKTTSSGRRLKAESKYYSDGKVLLLSDTLAYKYSKGRVKTNDNNWAFDNMNGKATMYSNVSVNVDQTYDANNNRIGFVYESKSLSTGKLESQGNERALYNVKNALVSSYSFYANLGMTRYDTVFNVYDADNYISEYYKAFAGYDKVWHSQPRKLSQYDASPKKNLTQILSQKWDVTSSTWIDTTKETNNYDAAGILTEQVFQSKTSAAAAWKNVSKTTFNNNISGDAELVITEIWDEVSLKYLPYKKQLNNFSGRNLIYRRDDEWNNKTAVFDSVRVEMYTYDAIGRKGSVSYEKFESGPMISYPTNGKELYTYDAANNITQVIYQALNTTHAWENSGRDRYTFDAFGDVVLHQNHSFELSLASWIYKKNNYVAHYYYEDATAISEEIKIAGKSFTVSPNPSNGIFTISSLNENINTAKATVYDMLGHKVYSKFITFSGNKSEINLNVPNGIYLVELLDINGIGFTEKLEIRR